MILNKTYSQKALVHTLKNPGAWCSQISHQIKIMGWVQEGKTDNEKYIICEAQKNINKIKTIR